MVPTGLRRTGWWWPVGLTFALVRLWSFWPGRHGTGPGCCDTAMYLSTARRPLFSVRFFTDQKPFGYPLFLKLVGSNLALTVWLQLSVSVAAWLFLAAVVSSLTANRIVRRLAPVGVLLLGTGWQISEWDTEMLTESLTISAFVVLVALALLAIERVSVPRIAALVGCALTLTSLRDTNGAVAAFMLLLVAAFVVRGYPRMLPVFLAVAAIGCVVLVTATVADRRWEILIADEIRRRVVNEAPELAYFRGHGMPDPAHLAQIIWHDTRGPAPAQTFVHDPRLATFMPWFMAHGRSTYDDYLLTHPETALLEPLRQYKLMLWDVPLATYHAPGFRRLPGGLNAVAYPGWDTFALDAELALVGLGAFATLKGVRRRSLAVPYALVLLSIPLAILVWDGEPSEVPRHSLLVGISVRLAVVVGGWLLLDAAVGRHRGDCRPVAPRPQ